MKRLQLLLLCVAAIFLAATFYMAFLIAERQASLREVSRYNTTWLASQAVAEFTRFQQRAAAFAVPGSQVTRDELGLRLDVLHNRVRVLKDGEFLEFLRAYPDAAAVVDQLESVLAQADTILGDLRDPGAGLELMRILAPVDRPLAMLAANANRYGAQRVAEDQQELLRLHFIFSGVSAGLAAFGVALIGSLGLQNRKLERARAEVLVQNARFDAAISNIPQGLALLDRSGSLLIWNNQLAKVLGDAGSLQSGVSLAEVLPPTYAAPPELPVAPESEVAELADGRTILIARTKVRDEGAVVSVEDITDRIAAEANRKRLEAQLQQAQKMEAVGQLTGGIAHDFNNLLTVILGNAEILVEQPGEQDVVESLAPMILEAAERGADLTHKLLAFGRRHSLRLENVSVDTIVRGLIPLLRRALGETVDLKSELAASDGTVTVDRSLLESALLNLTVNARDAMPRGGTVVIATGQQVLAEKLGNLGAGETAVFLSVTDTGTGMPPDVMARVFEPFFTTKEVGKGSGLGLSMVYGFAEQSGGSVRIASKEGEGTTVTIWLPAVAAEGITPVSEPRPLQSRKQRSGRVLVVEDDAQVLGFVSAQVSSLGYEVTSAMSAREALALLKAGKHFDILFSDVVLPGGVNGVELAGVVRKQAPRTKVVLTSGYSEEIFAKFGRPDADTALLKKPYKKSELAEVLESALAGAGPTSQPETSAALDEEKTAPPLRRAV